MIIYSYDSYMIMNYHIIMDFMEWLSYDMIIDSEDGHMIISYYTIMDFMR